MKTVTRPDMRGYEYIVIGAGSAGAIMAARLSAAGRRVLLVEAGGDDRWRIEIAMPAALGLPLLSDRMNWKFFDTRARDGGVYTPRGRVLGGSSSVNGMNWMRGNAQDYDSWDLEGWRYADVLPAFKALERFEDGETEYRGGGGPVQVERADCAHPLFDAFFAGGAQAGHALNPDHNAAQQLGLHRIQRNVGQGRRQTSAHCFLRRQSLPTLDVICHSRAIKLLFDGTRCTGATLLRKGVQLDVHAETEVIVSAGAILSPHLLLLSGVGDPDALRAQGIDVVLDQPQVGQGLDDHPCLVMDYALKDEGLSLHRALGWAGRAAIGAAWLAARKGLGRSNFFEAGAMLSTTGDARPDMQIECVAMRPDFGPDAITVEAGYHCAMSLQRPESRGQLRLRNADPLAAPAFAFSYLETQADQALAVRAVKTMRDLMRQPAAARRFGAELGGSDAARTDAEILAWCQANVESNYHPSCTLAMGRVTDAAGCVKGLERLRVVDASILPRVPTANLNAPVMMLAQKISADMLT